MTGRSDVVTSGADADPMTTVRSAVAAGAKSAPVPDRDAEIPASRATEARTMACPRTPSSPVTIGA
jgi:hypothetical protein